ncbi:microtubule binding protein [Cantharellus anzutake]|uniref:microtubule binding protein n=1 Tax=Cantharellus anzutake TaxID=1750568 RepID=UPI0019077A61|nr:microtubule binding protein [Cantharellus anzutake]KAF8327771.1 microtubule binding protein [Cantharellus anzutake]
MSRFVRPSKYRHVFGQPAKKENSIENVKVTTSAWDTNLISASGSYLSLNWASSGGGAFAILPLPSPFGPIPFGIPYKLPDIIPLARGHTAPVLDTDWSPFQDNVVASGGEDGKILVYKVESREFEGWGGDKWQPVDFDPVARIAGSARKIGQVQFHPTAAHVLAAASGDYIVKLWDLGSPEEPRSTLTGHQDTIQGLAFNTTGTLLATTCRDRKIRLFDPRVGGEAVRITDGHSGIKGSRIVWMGDKDRLATTGFSKMSDRQLSIWEPGSLNNVTTTIIDQSAGVVMPFWSDNGVIFLVAYRRFRFYEYESDALHPLSEHKSSDPQRGMCFLPRRALSVSECEIARAYKVTGTIIEPIAFIVPRKSDTFQSDIFPPAASDEPALTAAQFFSGKTAQPKLVDLNSGEITSSSAAVATTPSPFSAPTQGTPNPPTRTYTALAPVSVPAPEPSPLTQGRFVDAAPSPVVATSVYPTSFSLQPPAPVPRDEPSPVRTSGDDTHLAENAQLRTDLREAKAQIRNLELQVETLKANAARAAKTLQFGLE